MIDMTPGTRVVKNPHTWPPIDFEQWGCGEGVGIVLADPPGLPLGDIGMVDVRWPNGWCSVHPVKHLLPAPEYEI